ncbi:MAG: metal-dependent hydrolase [Bdellovibrio sp.]|nr:metal-dependent hydrolase [Bdellovibrio sp.]
MYLFGHLGIGATLVSPWTQRLRLRWLFLGTLLPDLIDKPLYYGLSVTTGKIGAQIGVVSGTRTFGHTLIFILVFLGICFSKRSKVLAAIALGIGTHLLLDGLSSWFMGDPKKEFLQVILWPYPNGIFPAYSYENLADHLSLWKRPFLLFCEGLGGFLLFRMRLRSRI